MKKLLTAGLSLIGIAIAPLFPLEANAIQYQNNSVYKVTENGQTTVYISGTPNGTALIDLGFVDRFSSRVAGACGEIRLSATTVGSAPAIQVGSPGTSVNIATLPVQLLPNCTNGSFAESRSANFKTPAGEVVIVGQTPGSAVLLNIPRDTERQVRINACGFGTLRNSTSFSIPANFTVNGTARALATLPTAPNPPRCTSGIGYIPASWIP